MDVVTKVKENWFTKKPRSYSGTVTILLGFFLFTTSFMFFGNVQGAAGWMAASPHSVFVEHQYWRLWTTLFAHADFGHLLANSILFLPFAFLLAGYFDLFLFPMLGIFLGGLINFLVLKTMPEYSTLIGISGVVNWMGAAYITLHFLIDRRQNFRYRFASALFLTLILFVPDTYRPEVSYLSHLIGYVLGVISGVFYYGLHRATFEKAQVLEYILEDDEVPPEELPEAGAFF